jgi:hypothetical protein
MGQITDTIKNKVLSLTAQNTEQYNFMKNRIVLLDNEKEDISPAISLIDAQIQNDIDEVNSKIKAVADAYQARLTAGCRTLRAWQLTGVILDDPVLYTYSCIEVSAVGFADTTSISTGVGTGVNTYEPGSLLGITPKNLYGIKYYNEPHTVDVIDGLVGSFIGTVGSGSTVLTVMSLSSSGALGEAKVGDLVTCSVSGVLAGITTIVGFSTAIADLSSVGIGSANSTSLVNTITLSIPALVTVTSPLSTGNFANFTILKGANQIEIDAIPMDSSSLTPQTLGIMDSSTLGIGTFIQYDNSGNPSSSQSWNPFLNGVQIGNSTIVPPSVGAGKTYFYEGFTVAPEYPSGSSTIAPVGTVITLTAFESPDTFNLPSCSAQETALSNAISALATAESEISSGLSVMNSRISVSNTLRKERNRYTLQIWGIRQVISELVNDTANLAQVSSALEDPSISGII